MSVRITNQVLGCVRDQFQHLPDPFTLQFPSLAKMIFPKSDLNPEFVRTSTTNQMLVQSGSVVWIRPEAVRSQSAQIEQSPASKAM
jgi:hypothetical protein